MGELMEHARSEILEAMYLSVARMNEYIANDNEEGYLSETSLQVQLRKNLEELQRLDK